MNVSGVGELIGRADDAAMEVEWRRNGLRRGQVVDEFREDAVVLRVLENEPRILFVVGLSAARLSERDGRGDGHECQDDPEWTVDSARHENPLCLIEMRGRHVPVYVWCIGAE